MEKNPPARKASTWLAIAWLASGTLACSKRDDVANQRRAGPLPTEAGLSVEVVPATGITLGLDGNKVATQAPYTQLGLEPGTHTLLVRGMGYVPMEMPVTLTAGQTLKVAVSLRPRPLDPEAPPEPPVSVARRSPERSAEARPPAAPTPPEIGVELAPDVLPITLQVVAQPDAAIVVDDEPSSPKALVLHHTYGTVAVGTMKFRYAIAANRALDLIVADDTATWQRDTLDVSPGTVIRFNRGFTRLRRIGGDGEQSLILRWNE